MGKQTKVKVEPTHTDDEFYEQQDEEPSEGTYVGSSTGLSIDRIRLPQDDFKNAPFIEEVDLNLYIKNTSRLKTYSVCLLDSELCFIYYNKLAKEHFEGSLNNLRIKSLWQLMIPQYRERLVNLISSNSKSGLIFKCMIYSKNIKRKTHKLKKKIDVSKKDIYYKYLKGLSCRLRPVRVKINSPFVDINGYWNILKPRRHAILNCYVLETRLSCRKPTLNDAILKDQIIKKYEQHTMNPKTEERGRETMRTSRSRKPKRPS